MKKKILVVVGTRPNFIKVTRFREVAKMFSNVDLSIVHTGQHFDTKMADVFFRQFGLQPDFFLDVVTGSVVHQMAEIMKGLEQVMLSFCPDRVVVVGDVNSTLAAALTANKLNIPVAHVESGLRSFDKSMPEEHNRILTDNLADMFFVTEDSGYKHLIAEGKQPENIFRVGNTMIDTLIAFRQQIDQQPILTDLGIQRQSYVLLTMHRPANVDDSSGLQKMLDLLQRLTLKYKVVFPVHPRTIRFMTETNLLSHFQSIKNLTITEPLDYFSFQKLIKECFFVITDSGGIQEETTFLQIPCLTLRPNTERPVTVDLGTNTLLPFEPEVIDRFITAIEQGTYKKGSIPPLWDGKATERIIKILSQ